MADRWTDHSKLSAHLIRQVTFMKMSLHALKSEDERTEDDHSDERPSKCHASHDRTIIILVDSIRTVDTVEHYGEGEHDYLLRKISILPVLTKFCDQKSLHEVRRRPTVGENIVGITFPSSCHNM